jgi:hypothetical protein
MRAKVERKMNRVCEATPIVDFCGCFPTIDYLISCKTRSASKTVHKKK